MRAQQWLGPATDQFLAAVDALPDADLDSPSLLPGWTRRHVVAHVHYNAEALRRLLGWARTGEESRMYDGPEQRAAEIEAGAALPVAELRSLVHRSAEDLAADVTGMPGPAWEHPVVTASGRTVPVSEVPWLRVREVAVHAVDLACGIGFADLPEEVNAALALDVVGKRAASGEAAALAEWLTGRSASAPTLGPWL